MEIIMINDGTDSCDRDIDNMMKKTIMITIV